MISRARQWLIQGGGGHEDGESGIRAVTLGGECLVEFLEAYDEWLRETTMGGFPISDSKEAPVDLRKQALAKLIAAADGLRNSLRLTSKDCICLEGADCGCIIDRQYFTETAYDTARAEWEGLK